MASVERQCTVLMPFERAGPQDEASELQASLEKKEVAIKVETMKKIIKLMLNGEQLGGLLMSVIRFVIPNEDHQLKKLVYLYLEVVDKTGADGKLLPEMILVCNMLRNDLNHANEFVRGCALRFLSKLKEPEILEPLVPSVKSNLEHRHSYVRRNAVLAIYNCYRTSDTLVPDAADLIDGFLQMESDASAKRNAFLMLVHCAQDRAVEYVLSVIDQISSLGDIIQLVMLELVRRVCRANPLEKSKYMQAMVGLLSSPSPSVTFECCGALVSLSTNAHVVRAATQSYCQLLSHHSDNNVKLIVLDRLTQLKSNHASILQDSLMDIMRGLASPNVDIKRKILVLSIELVNPRNIEAVVGVLKKEVIKTQNDELEKAGEYRQLLIQTIHGCVLKFPEVAGGVVHLLMDFIGDSNVSSAGDVIVFVREVVETYPKLRDGVVQRLLDCFPQIRATKVFRVALWIFSEYCLTPEELEAALNVIKASLGDLPFCPSETGTVGFSDEPRSHMAAITQAKPALLSDGSYATQTSESTGRAAGADATGTGAQPTVRSLILGGDFFLATVVSSTLAKLAMRMAEIKQDPVAQNQSAASLMMYLCAFVRYGRSMQPQGLDDDSHERICQCLTMLSDLSNPALREVWLRKTRESFAESLVEKQQAAAKEATEVEEAKAKLQADDLIQIRQLKGKQAGGSNTIEDEEEADLNRATGAGEHEEDFGARLQRVVQLTGLSDPVYAEAVVTVHSYDIVLDVLVINQTDETLHNACLELATVGDLKLCERPQNYTLAPRASRSLRANIKVSSTETGIIYGNLVFETAAAAQGAADNRNIVTLVDIHIDIMDYITPASCTELQFRVMWAEFEWENKVAVSTQIKDPLEYLNHILSCTNLRCLTPASALSGDCLFLAANLYAKSIFGEDALVNLSVEKQRDGTLAGSIRIRSKTQGIALSLGDKITLRQRGPE